MQKLKLFLIGSGFFWIFVWSVFGSILGSKINLLLLRNVNTSWLLSVQKNILTAAHSHMNNMAVTLIIFALSMSSIQGLISKKTIHIVSIVNMVSIPLFGFGMFLEAFYPTSLNHISLFSILTAIGGIGYMMTIALWSSFFFVAFIKSK